MIIGIGTDIVDIRRVENMRKRFSERFESRFFTELERENAKEQMNPLPRYAKYIAAKEATYKSLALPKNNGVSWQDFSISYAESGQPIMTLSGKAHQLMMQRCSKGQTYTIHLSISDEPPYAVAYVITEITLIANSSPQIPA